MKILVSNDDSINSEGIKILVEYLKNANYEVDVVAPFEEASGTGHGVTLHKPIRITKHYNTTNNDFFGYGITGLPADCIKIGVSHLFSEKKYDYIISGINRGENTGSDVIYSGTVAAAAEGALQGIKSIAVSAQAINGKSNYNLAAKFLIRYLEKINNIDFPENTFLNINVPHEVNDDLNKYVYTNQGNKRYVDKIIENTDPQGNRYYWLGIDFKKEDNVENYDSTVLKNRAISVTPINLNLTDYNFLELLKRKEK